MVNDTLGGRLRDRISASRSSAVTELPGLAIAVSALTVFAGRAGILAGAVVIGFWVVLPVEYAFGAGQVALVAVTPGIAGPELLLGVEAGLAMLVVGSLHEASIRPRVIIGWLSAYAAVGTTILFVAATNIIPVLHSAVAVWVIAVAYELYRYDPVTLGLTGAEQR